MVTVTC